MSSLLKKIISLSFYILPKHFLSLLMHRFMRIKIRAIKNLQIKWFTQAYQVNLDEAKINKIEQFTDFNDFFTRELSENARQIVTNTEQLISPVDGEISECGNIIDQQLFQAKGQYYRLDELLAGDQHIIDCFQENSQFITIYLSPKDYHRIHMPCDGSLQKMLYVPGDLFSVNKSSVQHIPRLFARNERVISLFETRFGPMALIQVGAIFVSSVETVWHGVVTPPRSRSVKTFDYAQQPIDLKQGEEMGRFNMGSTVILVFNNPSLEFTSSTCAETPVKLGQILSNYHE